MTSPFDDLIRSTLSEIAEEATPVNLTHRAVGTARRRRTVTLALSGVAVVAILVGTPFAVSAAQDGGGHGQPAGPKPSPSDVQATAPPAPTGQPTPSPGGGTVEPTPSSSTGGPKPSPSGSAESPVPSPSPSDGEVTATPSGSFPPPSPSRSV